MFSAQNCSNALGNWQTWLGDGLGYPLMRRLGLAARAVADGCGAYAGKVASCIRSARSSGDAAIGGFTTRCWHVFVNESPFADLLCRGDEIANLVCKARCLRPARKTLLPFGHRYCRQNLCEIPIETLQVCEGSMTHSAASTPRKSAAPWLARLQRCGLWPWCLWCLQFLLRSLPPRNNRGVTVGELVP